MVKNGKNRHHVIPRSRGGRGDHENILVVNKRKHDAYNILFGNSTPEEAVVIILTEWTTPEWRAKNLKNLDERVTRLEKLIFPETRDK